MNDHDADKGRFDHYARLLRRLLGVPTGLVSIVEPERQVFVGAVGLPAHYQASRETPLSHSFCQYVVKDERPLIINDARLDPLVADNLAIPDLGVGAYAGWPVTNHTGRVIGSLCAIDSSPREWSREEIETLADLALACSAELSQRERADDVAMALTSAEETGEQTRALLTLSTALAATATLAEVAAAVVRVSSEELGCVRGGMWLRDASVVAAEARATRGSTGSPRAESLRFVEDASSTWRSAATFSDLPLDETNPLGASLVRKRMVAFDTRAAQNEVYPHLVTADQLGEARAFLPLVRGDTAYGALALMWPRARSFTDSDRVSMLALASYTAQAVHCAQLLESRSAAALTLQHALLTDLPQPDHLTLSARYRPADTDEEVGGDWYDAVLTPAGSTYLMIGDVSGHDIDAAAYMGQLRSMVRMAAWQSSTTSNGSPASVLQLVDQAARDLGIDTLATTVLACIDRADPDARPGVRCLRWSSAGHLSPILVDPDGHPRLLESTAASDVTDPMLGLASDTVRHDHVVELQPSSRLLFYTDGLVERRGESIDDGLERLLAAVSGAAGLDTQGLLDHLLETLVPSRHEDDVAVLVVDLET